MNTRTQETQHSSLFIARPTSRRRTPQLPKRATWRSLAPKSGLRASAKRQLKRPRLHTYAATTRTGWRTYVCLLPNLAVERNGQQEVRHIATRQESWLESYGADLDWADET